MAIRPIVLAWGTGFSADLIQSENTGLDEGKFDDIVYGRTPANPTLISICRVWFRLRPQLSLGTLTLQE